MANSAEPREIDATVGINIVTGSVMPKSVSMPVKDLAIDLKNFRTVEQTDALQAIQAMILIDGEKFWALMESLLDDGYLPTENIIVLETSAVDSPHLVKEGNRRVAALKLIHGHLPNNGIAIPDALKAKIATLPSAWKTENEAIPCAIYPAADFAIVDKIVALTHGKGELAGRSAWNTTARARHNRDKNGGGEPGLDLLEKYLVHGENLNKQQAKRWAGDYNLSVLDEAMGKIALRFGAKNGPELSRSYPELPHKEALDDLMRDIGVEIITFPALRNADFLESYLPSATPGTAVGSTPQSAATGASSAPPSPVANASAQSQAGVLSPTQRGTTTSAGGSNTSAAHTSSVKKTAAVAIGDPKAVKRMLRKFSPLGANRQKVVTLRNEALKLVLKDNPIAFCFLLRSMFEISAKAYCDDHKTTGGPSFKKPNGDENKLVDVLESISKHFTHPTNGKADPVMVKILHGAMTELKKPEGILSVTSMNQLVHNPTFSVASTDIAILFGNIFPLLEAMNG